jgi:hypothetical protein
MGPEGGQTSKLGVGVYIIFMTVYKSIIANTMRSTFLGHGEPHLEQKGGITQCLLTPSLGVRALKVQK